MRGRDLDGLRPLGIDRGSRGALWVLPLIDVAWADGWLEFEDHQHLLALSSSWGLGSDAQLLVQDWCRHVPSDAYLEHARRIVARRARSLGSCERLGDVQARLSAHLSPSRSRAPIHGIATRWLEALSGRGAEASVAMHPDLARSLRPVRGVASEGPALIVGRTGRLVSLPPEGLAIGLDPGARIQIGAPGAPWASCRLRARQGGWLVEDLSARTRVNGERITLRRLLGGEIVRVASAASLRFWIPAQQDPRQEAA